MKRICAAVLAATIGICASAQEKKEAKVEKHVFVTATAGGGAISHMSIVASPVKGAPYSADVTTETVQTLADGNRIINTHSAKQYRDAEGRTRSDSTMHAMGPWAASGQAPSITNIADPVSGTSYFVNHMSKTVMKNKLPPPPPPPPAGQGKTAHVKQETALIERKVVMEGAGTGVATFDVRVPAPAGMPEMMWVEALPHASKEAAKSESLGKQTIEGVECEGTRTTMTIAAGAIGNERPLITVMEEWYSPKLRMVVLSKRTDPRFGESTMKLTRIVQGDQARSLFEPPADYKVEEGPKGNAIFLKQKKEE